MILVNGFLLGIASGGACLSYCAPVLVPYLLGEGRTLRGNAALVGGFLGGRFIGYLAFSLLAWAAHVAIVEAMPHRAIITGAITISLAVLLIAYGFGGQARCRVRTTHHHLLTTQNEGCVVRTLRIRNPWLVPVLLGLGTGASLCPPFLMALGSAAQLPQLWQSLLFFAAFFAGTSVYILPLPLVGIVGRHDAIRTVGRLAAGVAGLLYLYSGIMSVVAGMP
jgi:sulfite exporter TauE/SafE